MEEREILCTILSNIGKGIVGVDLDNNVLFLNELAKNLMGWDTDYYIGKNLYKIFNVITKNEIENTNKVNLLFEGEEYFNQNITILDKENQKRRIKYDIFKVKDKTSIINKVIVFDEIFNEIKLENELEKIKQLESIAVLASGIAHNFNNILTCMVGNISFVKLKLASKNKMLSNLLEETEKSAFKARDLTQKLLTLSKSYVPIKKISSIKEIIIDSAKLLLRGTNIQCIFNISDNLWLVYIDEGQIEQVIYNLILNAIQAMPNGGKIIITIENISITSENNIIQLKENDYIKITIQDEGIGITEENLLKIFEPFYTTKKKGSGLGLATCSSIISNHNGLLTVESKVGTGTNFYIYLPVFDNKKY